MATPIIALDVNRPPNGSLGIETLLATIRPNMIALSGDTLRRLDHLGYIPDGGFEEHIAEALRTQAILGFQIPEPVRDPGSEHIRNGQMLQPLYLVFRRRPTPLPRVGDGEYAVGDLGVELLGLRGVRVICGEGPLGASFFMLCIESRQKGHTHNVALGTHLYSLVQKLRHQPEGTSLHLSREAALQMILSGVISLEQLRTSEERHDGRVRALLMRRGVLACAGPDGNSAGVIITTMIHEGSLPRHGFVKNSHVDIIPPNTPIHPTM